jgi:hypothetical protein
MSSRLHSQTLLVLTVLYPSSLVPRIARDGRRPAPFATAVGVSPKEAARVLRPGGRIAMIESWITVPSFVLYRYFTTKTAPSRSMCVVLS